MCRHCLRFVTVFPAPKRSERWSHRAAVKISSGAWGWWDSGWRVPLQSLTDGVCRSSSRNPTCSCPANALSSLGISPLNWLGRSPAVCLLPPPSRGVISPIFLHPCKQRFQQIRDCGTQRQGPRASRWPDSLLLSLPSISTKPCHGLIPLPSTTHAKPSPSPTAYFFFLFSFTVD